VTEDYVIGLEAITTNGEKIQTGIFSKHQGFAIEDILIASEGTLAIITKVAFRLIPIPKPGTTLLVAFANPTNAAKTIEAINRSGMILTVMEYLDGDAAACSNAYEKTDGLDNVAALLLLETTGETAETDTKALKKICTQHAASYFRVETDPQKAQTLWKIRRNLSKAVKSMAKIRISEDVAVPNSKFAELVSFVDQRNRQGRLKMNAFGHAGDGNLHVNFMGMTGTSEELTIIEEEIEAMLKKTIELGGTLTGEHGVGIAKRKYLPWEFDSPTIGAMKTIKTIFDPNELLNSGKIFFQP
jgi:FAD/FMN-containing dehydrogenase